MTASCRLHGRLVGIIRESGCIVWFPTPPTIEDAVRPNSARRAGAKRQGIDTIRVTGTPMWCDRGARRARGFRPAE